MISFIFFKFTIFINEYTTLISCIVDDFYPICTLAESQNNPTF